MKILPPAFVLVLSLLVNVAPAWGADVTTPADSTASIPPEEKDVISVGYLDAHEFGDDKMIPNKNAEIQNTEVIARKGTTAIEAVKMAGLEKHLTEYARLIVVTYKNNDKVASAIVDVGAVRAGKAQDVVLATGQNADLGNRTIIFIRYTEFHFPGGTPGEFVDALREHFGVDWNLAQFPPQLQNVRVPEFRKEDGESNDGSANPFNNNEGDETSTAFTIVKLYNSIADRVSIDQASDIGHWHWEGMLYRPRIVLLTPSFIPATSSASSQKVKALPLQLFATADNLGLNEQRILLLEKDIETTHDRILNNSSGPVADFNGSFSIQRDSRIMVVIGTQSYIDMVESVVAAHVENRKLGIPDPSPPASPFPKQTGSSPPAK